MKILLLQDAEWRKKGPHQQHHLMELLSLRGHEIVVIGFDQLWREEKASFYSSRQSIQDLCRFYKGAEISYILPPFFKFPLLDYASFLFTSKIEISRQISKFNPDIIIGYSSIFTNYWGLKSAKKLGIPYIYYCVDNPSSYLVPKPFVSIAEFIIIKIMKESDRVLTINRALNDYVINLGADPFTTEVVPQGVDMKRFNISQMRRNYIRSKYKISEEDNLLFFMGWLYTFSGLKEVIQDIDKNKDIHPNIKLMIVGYGDDYLNLKELVESLNIQNRVILTGKKPYEEIPELISAADICLLSAHNDAVIRDIAPIKMYEYLAMEKPVISTKLPGVMKEFGENNGVIFVDKPEDIVEAVINIDQEVLEETKLNAKNYIKDYDWQHIITDFERTLQELIDSKL
jgi:glycosyltransferase involved in cell wall biosynthesis